MSERLFTFAVDELQTVSCKCPKCANLIVYHLDTDPKYGVPQGCPTCNETMVLLARALVQYRDFYRTAIDSGLPIRIHSKPVPEKD